MKATGDDKSSLPTLLQCFDNHGIPTNRTKDVIDLFESGACFNGSLFGESWRNSDFPPTAICIGEDLTPIFCTLRYYCAITALLPHTTFFLHGFNSKIINLFLIVFRNLLKKLKESVVPV